MKAILSICLRLITGTLLVSPLLQCDPQLIDDPIPVDHFDDFVVNTNLPEYASLRVDGGWAYIGDVGVRGIILYRNGNEYLAYERTCSYHPAEACSTVDVDASGLFMIDACCGSTFNLSSGEPTGGPAWRSLVQYTTNVQFQVITITDLVKL